MKDLLVLSLAMMLMVSVRGQTTSTGEYAPPQGPDHPLTMEECIAYAVANNPNIEKVRLNEASNEYRIDEVKAQGLPQVNATGQFLDNYALPEQILPGEFLGMPGEDVAVTFGTRYNVSGNVEVTQMLFNKSYFTGLKAARSSQELYKLQSFSTVEELAYNVARVYYQLQITERQRSIVEANLERIEQLLEITRVQYEEGIVKKVDVDQLRVNRTNILTEMQRLDISYAQQLNLLKFYMGMDMDAGLAIREETTEEPEYNLADELLLSQNTNLQLLDKQMELLRLEQENIKAGYFPTVSAFARYGYQGQSQQFRFSGEDYNSFGAGTWGINLNVPIFDGLRKKNQIQQNQVNQEKLRLDQIQTVRSAKMAFKNANNNLDQNQALIDQQEANMELARELYEVTRLSYREGIAPLTELLNAETSLKEAQTQYLTALLQLKLAELEHLKSSGRFAEIIRQDYN